MHFQIIGILLIVLAFVHAGFPKRFNWEVELKALSLINRQMIMVHTFFIALIVLMMGILCLTSAQDLSTTAFGKRISFGLGIFWSIRFVIQFFGYSSKLWKGKKFETSMHILFSCFWAYLSFVFLMTYFQ